MNIKAAFMVPHPPIIIPEIGKGQEAAISDTTEGYREVAKKVKEASPDTIVIISPHSIMYADYFHISPGTDVTGSFAAFRAPQVSFYEQYDVEFSNYLTTEAEKNCVMAGFLGERDRELDHGTMVPLYFINEAYGKEPHPRIVRIGLSGLQLSEHYRLGMLIAKTAKELNRNIVFIASGDLSHRLKEDGPYGYQKEGPEYDAKIMDVMEKADFYSLLTMEESLLSCAGECGHRSFCVMAGALDGIEVEGKRLSYEGTFGVGYGIVCYHIKGENPARHYLQKFEEVKIRTLEERKAREDSYVKLARKSLESYILQDKIIKPENELPEEMLIRQAGVFVSLKKDGILRGCIGTIGPVRDCIAEEIIYNAISAGENDPRFDPVGEEELPDLVYSVDVLGETEMIASKEELDVKRYGVIVTKGVKRGLLLPNLEGIDTVEKQIAIAKQKAGIKEEEEVSLSRFEVIRHY